MNFTRTWWERLIDGSARQHVRKHTFRRPGSEQHFGCSDVINEWGTVAQLVPVPASDIAVVRDGMLPSTEHLQNFVRLENHRRLPSGFVRRARVNHLVLLGDSIFDNGAYVPGEEPLIDQLREALEDRWYVTQLAVDGHVASDVVGQIDSLPNDATHLIVSVGGNDALQRIDILQRRAEQFVDVISELADIQDIFRTNYRDMFQQVVACRRAAAVCTIYDQIPFPDPQLRRYAMVFLSAFNDCIIREACHFGVPVLDLRQVCHEPGDFSKVSVIEPSCEGALKIAYAVARLLRDHDFSNKRTVLYS
jgi:hypothetical protein